MTDSLPALRPWLVVAGAARAIDYYRQALGAEEVERHTDPGGRIVHAELALGGARVTLKDEDATDRVPTSAGSPVLLMLEVEDVDAVAERMIAGGGAVVFPVRDSGHGRQGRVADPFGHLWLLSERAHAPKVVDLAALTDLQTPWCVLVAATLRTAQHVAAGIGAVEDLAAAAGCDARALHAVLRHLVDRGVFEEPAPGRFALNDGARQLLEPPSRFLDLEGIGGRIAHAWSTLPTFVRTGQPAYAEVFGRPFWEDLDAHPEVAAGFDALMGPTGHGAPNPEFEIVGGWGKVHSVVDVGGGTGAMLAEILRLRPQLKGTLVDLPRTVARAAATFQAAGVAERATAVGQSFFDPLPAGADLYLLRKVLNDWPDPETVAILRRCADAARPDGRVVILSGVAPDDEPPRLAVDMLVAGGRTNSLTEFRELARQAGLEVVAAGPQPAASFVVECRPLA